MQPPHAKPGSLAEAQPRAAPAPNCRHVTQIASQRGWWVENPCRYRVAQRSQGSEDNYIEPRRRRVAQRNRDSRAARATGAVGELVDATRHGCNSKRVSATDPAVTGWVHGPVPISPTTISPATIAVSCVRDVTAALPRSPAPGFPSGGDEHDSLVRSLADPCHRTRQDTAGAAIQADSTDRRPSVQQKATPETSSPCPSP